MKNIRFVFLIALLSPISAFAHPGDHQKHNFMTIVGHFFSQPDHLFMLAWVVALLWSVSISQRLFLVRRVLRFVQKRFKHTP
jgi:hydrogenase/urease accessory protein HupE